MQNQSNRHPQAGYIECTYHDINGSLPLWGGGGSNCPPCSASPDITIITFIYILIPQEPLDALISKAQTANWTHQSPLQGSFSCLDEHGRPCVYECAM